MIFWGFLQIFRFSLFFLLFDPPKRQLSFREDLGSGFANALPVLGKLSDFFIASLGRNAKEVVWLVGHGPGWFLDVFECFFFFGFFFCFLCFLFLLGPELACGGVFYVQNCCNPSGLEEMSAPWSDSSTCHGPAYISQGLCWSEKHETPWFSFCFFPLVCFSNIEKKEKRSGAMLSMAQRRWWCHPSTRLFKASRFTEKLEVED